MSIKAENLKKFTSLGALTDFVGTKYQVSLGTLLVVALVLTGAFYWGVRSVGKLESQLKQVEARESLYKTKNSELEAERKADREFIVSLSSRQSKLEKEIADNRQEFESQIRRFRSAQTPQEVQRNSEEVLNVKPEIANDKFLFTPAQVTEFIVFKVDRDRLQVELNKMSEQYRLEQKKTVTLQAQLGREITQRQEADKLMQDYKKIVKRSKFRRFLGGVVKFGSITGAFVLGVLVAG